MGVHHFGPENEEIDLVDWIVYDTYTGQKVSEIRTSERAPTIELQGTLSADGQQIYFLSVPAKLGTPAPWSTTLIAFDLATGAEVRRVELPGVLAGMWDTGESFQVPNGCFTDTSGDPITTVPEQESLNPAMAVSSSGDQIAIVHADSDTVTVVDTVSFQVISTVAFNRTELPASTIEAQCDKSSERTRYAVYSSDEDALFITGADRRLQENDHAAYTDFGLLRVELSSGDSVAVGNQLPPNTIVARMPVMTDAGLTVITYRNSVWSPGGTIESTTTAELYNPQTLELPLKRESFSVVSLLISPVELAPVAYVATPEPVTDGAITLSVSTRVGDVELVRVVADGQVVFEGPLDRGDVTQPISGDQIVITSSDPGYTVINREGMPQMLTRSETEEYP